MRRTGRGRALPPALPQGPPGAATRAVQRGLPGHPTRRWHNSAMRGHAATSRCDTRAQRSVRPRLLSLPGQHRASIVPGGWHPFLGHRSIRYGRVPAGPFLRRSRRVHRLCSGWARGPRLRSLPPGDQPLGNVGDRLPDAASTTERPWGRAHCARTPRDCTQSWLSATTLPARTPAHANWCPRDANQATNCVRLRQSSALECTGVFLKGH